MRIFISHSPADLALANVIRERLQRSGNEVIVRTDELLTSDIITYMYAQIKRAAVVVVISSKPSPNTFFELGLTMGAGRRLVLVSDRNAAVVSDLSGLPFVQIRGDHEADAQATAEAVLLVPLRPAGYTHRADEQLSEGLDAAEFADALSPQDFESNIRHWFDAHGVTTSTPNSRVDLGYDFAITLDRRVYLVQVKLTARQSLVSLNAVRDMTTIVARHSAAGGILVSNARYTSAAINLAKVASIALVTSEDLSRVPSVSALLSTVMTSESSSA